MPLINQTDLSNTHYDIREAGYWDAASLDGEMNRVYDICVGCRLCWNLCPSFPALFDPFDAQGSEKQAAAEREGRVAAGSAATETGELPAGRHAREASPEAEFVGDVTELSQAEKWRVVDLCYQCKLCEAVCPYTPADEHDFQLDFPRLMLRAAAQRTRQSGQRLSDKFLANTDASGRLGTALAPLSNLANSIRPFRFLMDKALGISRHRKLPTFHRKTFAKRFKRHARRTPDPANSAGKAVIFATCYTNANDPEVGMAAAEVLAHNEVTVRAASQHCCGAPYLSSGDFDGFRRQALPNVEELAQWVDEGYQIVVTGPPTCSMTLRQDYAYLSDGNAEFSEKIAKVAGNTLDISQYLMRLHAEGRLKTDFVRSLGTINYHLPCHLKAQKSGYKSRDLLRLVPDTKVTMVDKCSGMDGGWGMKSENFAESMKVAAKLVDALSGKSAAATCSDCTLAGMQIAQASGSSIRPQHPIRMIHQAYGLDERTSKREETVGT